MKAFGNKTGQLAYGLQAFCMNRRKFIKNSLWGITGLGVLGGLYTWQVEPFWLEFVKVKMPIRNLPEQLVGKRLLQISDIHIGKRFDHQFIIDAFKKAQALRPDFVVYTGDYVSTYRDKVQFDLLEETFEHLVKGKLGTLAILGNHDYGKNWAEPAVANRIAGMLEQHGIEVLRNRSLELEGLRFIGFDDFWSGQMRASEALAEFDASKAHLALCHNPDVCDLDVWGNYNSWILAGHTHGGQVKPPFLPPPLLPVKNKRYSAGLFTLDQGKTLYINRALGHLWQIRMNVRPEITVFELERA
jgi:uncharacterized protein